MRTVPRRAPSRCLAIRDSARLWRAVPTGGPAFPCLRVTSWDEDSAETGAIPVFGDTRLRPPVAGCADRRSALLTFYAVPMGAAVCP